MTFSWDHIQVIFADANAHAGIRQRHQHFAAGLAALGMGVLYIEEPGNWLTVGRSPEKPASNWTAWKAGAREVEPGVWVWTPPPGMPVGYWSAAINARNHAHYLRAMLEVLGEPPRNRIALLACNPLAVAWLAQLDLGRAVYDCCDEFEHFPIPARRPQVILEMERTLFAQCDITIFSSAATLRTKVGARLRPVAGGPRMRSPQGSPRQVVQVRNACDPIFLSTPDKATAAMPADLGPIAKRGPVLLYFGALSDWFDDALLEGICKARPGWQIVLLGPPMRPFVGLRACSNCHLLGKKPHDVLPLYAAQAHVALLPHRVVRITSVADHVKVYEYLAAGLPVVSSPMEEVRSFGSLIRTAGPVGEWVTEIEAALAESSEAKMERRRYAQAQTWAARIPLLRQVLGRPDKRQIDAARGEQLAEEERLLSQLRAEAIADDMPVVDKAATPYVHPTPGENQL